LLRALGVPLIATLHGYDVTREPRHLLTSGRLSWMRYALLQDRLMREGALFLAVSDALRQIALARGFPAHRTRTHYLGVELGRFAGGGEREPDLVLHVGRLVEKKGTAVLLRRCAPAESTARGDRRRARTRAARAARGRARCAGPVPRRASRRRGRRVDAPRRAARRAERDRARRRRRRPADRDRRGRCRRPADGRHMPFGHSRSGHRRRDRLARARTRRRCARRAYPRDARGARAARTMGAAARALAEARFDLRTQTARLEAIYDEVRAG
jgi:hypothetical protein